MLLTHSVPLSLPRIVTVGPVQPWQSMFTRITTLGLNTITHRKLLFIQKGLSVCYLRLCTGFSYRLQYSYFHFVHIDYPLVFCAAYKGVLCVAVATTVTWGSAQVVRSVRAPMLRSVHK